MQARGFKIRRNSIIRSRCCSISFHLVFIASRGSILCFQDTRLRGQRVRGLNPAFARGFPLTADRSSGNAAGGYSMRVARRNTDIDSEYLRSSHSALEKVLILQISPRILPLSLQCCGVWWDGCTDPAGRYKRCPSLKKLYKNIFIMSPMHFLVENKSTHTHVCKSK